jgi:hypothetical protein
MMDMITEKAIQIIGRITDKDWNAWIISISWPSSMLIINSFSVRK